MEQTQIWVLTSAVVVMGSVLGFIGANWWKNQRELLKEIVDELKKLNINDAKMGETIKDHDRRITKLEDKYSQS